MLPPAPDLFSTTNGTPNFACRCCCRMRASKSADPPAANGTTMVTGRCGQASCACAGAASATTAATARTRRICKPPGFLRSHAVIQRNDGQSIRRWRKSHRLEMGVSSLVEVLVGVAHGLGLAASEHDLEIDRLEAVVLIAVDDAGGTRDAFPGPEAGGEALAALVLDKDVEVALEHEETLFDLVGVGGLALSRLHIHDPIGAVLRRDYARIAVFA